MVGSKITVPNVDFDIENVVTSNVESVFNLIPRCGSVEEQKLDVLVSNVSQNNISNSLDK